MLRRDGRPQSPQAWSQAPAPNYRPAPRQDRQQPPPQQRRDWAPTQRPERIADPAPNRRPPRGNTPPPAPPRRPAAPPSRPGPPSRPARRRPLGARRILRRLAIVLVVLVVAMGASMVYLDGTLARVDALADYDGRVGDTPGTNWLLVGSDSRVGLTPEQEQELATGGEVGADRTDTVLLVHIPPGGGATTMISLPRDSYVSVPGFGQDKLNASFALGGPQLLVQTVEGATGVHIDHYAEIGFGGFASIVDAVGGVDICVPYPIDDPLAGLRLEPGCQELNGAQALGFVRTRATPLADLDRMNNQRLFLSALLSKATSPGTFLNPFRAWSLMSGAAGSLRVDDGDHLWNLARLAWAMRGETVTTTVPVGGFDDVYGIGNVLLWDRERAVPFFGAISEGDPIPPELLAPAP
ncbi:LCP family protein [Rhodococcus sp. 852002-51564_SCH6189132-a]|uniref:LCP family protein n=1 Tax=Rhodococcus sp. 852002-51564_SCH6189132-a TaxID=1834103 RepID=UPI001E4649E4|nr:LCP family protein [Rhodococcus sp. 852002-51564_SCH6189132-a]